MLVFRSHDEVPEGITCSTLIGLAQEWVAINKTAEYPPDHPMRIPGLSAARRHRRPD